MRATIAIPKNWRRVTRGNVRVGDRILTIDKSQPEWTVVEQVELESAVAWDGNGLRVSGWGMVIREVK